MRRFRRVLYATDFSTKALLGSVAMRVLATARCPVLTVRA